MLRSAAALKLEIEGALSQRVPGALSPRLRPAVELFPTGIAALDALLEGGLPRGSVSEVVGLASTGRTALALSTLAGLTQHGAACAWMDVDDVLDPQSAAACGVDLERLLWVRGGGAAPAISHAPKGQLQRPLQRGDSTPAYGNSMHPRSEVRNMDHAVSQLFRGEGGLLRDKRIGTPGAPNRPLTDMAPRCAEAQPHRRKQEQVATDRLPPRRGDSVPKAAAVSLPHAAAQPFPSRQKFGPAKADRPWAKLEYALKATDLLLQAGGFSMLVLDMGNIAPEHALRVPLATWYRFRLAAEQAQTALILLTQTSCAKSCASVVLHCEQAQQAWSASSETALFQGVEYRVSLDRKRGENEISPLRKKAPGSVSWAGRSPWVR